MDYEKSIGQEAAPLLRLFVGGATVKTVGGSLALLFGQRLVVMACLDGADVGRDDRLPESCLKVTPSDFGERRSCRNVVAELPDRSKFDPKWRCCPTGRPCLAELGHNSPNVWPDRPSFANSGPKLAQLDQIWPKIQKFDGLDRSMKSQAARHLSAPRGLQQWVQARDFLTPRVLSLCGSLQRRRRINSGADEARFSTAVPAQKGM